MVKVMKAAISIVMLGTVLFIPQLIFADECMEGDCENGMGKGFTEEGQIYDGQWLNGEPHGQGRLFVSKGKVIEGNWLDGELLKEKVQIKE